MKTITAPRDRLNLRQMRSGYPEQDDGVVYSTLRCSAVYHISQLKGRGADAAFLLYDRCCALGFESDKAFMNVETVLAPYLHCHELVLYRAAKLLCAAGWLIVESRKQGSPTTYRPVSHALWTAVHGTDSCVITYSPDYWEKDALGKAFYGITGGIKIGGPNVLAGWRKQFPVNDDLILEIAREYVAANPKPKHKYEYTCWLAGFGEYLRDQRLQMSLRETSIPADRHQPIPADRHQPIPAD